jgi:hypothetical protein
MVGEEEGASKNLALLVFRGSLIEMTEREDRLIENMLEQLQARINHLEQLIEKTEQHHKRINLHETPQ